MKSTIRSTLRDLAALIAAVSAIGLGSSLLTGCTSDSSAPPQDEKALQAQYQADAEKEIDETNADTAMNDLEDEINGDAAEE